MSYQVEPMPRLSRDDLIPLLKSVFPRLPGDRRLAVLIDFPASVDADNPDWRRRRLMARDWAAALASDPSPLKLEAVHLVGYPAVGSNNADLPASVTLIRGKLPAAAPGLPAAGTGLSLGDVFAGYQLFLAPTEFSTTAPLKVAAKRAGFRAATMPGFSSRMIPALKIDYTEVSRRVGLIKELLDRAKWAEVDFSVIQIDGSSGSYRMLFDLRYRKAHLSSGRFPERGTAGNLPSGETYIVPYEGEKGRESGTSGILPVQIEDEVVLFRVDRNRAVGTLGSAGQARRESKRLKREPAYGNMAELGFGVLADFGLQPIGEILLDEKLGFHVAFGRSEHFGGATGPSAFSAPSEVIHLDRIYIPATQPLVTVASLSLVFDRGRTETIMENGQYLVFQKR